MLDENWFLLASQPQGGASRSVGIVGYYIQPFGAKPFQGNRNSKTTRRLNSQQSDAVGFCRSMTSLAARCQPVPVDANMGCGGSFEFSVLSC